MEVEYVTLGGGCFWCLEAVFERIDGVESVVPGYAGGTSENPSYEQVCTGITLFYHGVGFLNRPGFEERPDVSVSQYIICIEEFVSFHKPSQM